MVSSDKCLKSVTFWNIVKHILHLFPFLGGEFWKCAKFLIFTWYVHVCVYTPHHILGTLKPGQPQELVCPLEQWLPWDLYPQEGGSPRFWIVDSYLHQSAHSCKKTWLVRTYLHHCLGNRATSIPLKWNPSIRTPQSPPPLNQFSTFTWSWLSQFSKQFKCYL